MISAGHMLGGSWACSLSKFLKKCNLVRFDVSLYAILGPPPPQTSSFACYMRPHSGPLISFLAYYMGAPSDQFLHLLWRPPYVFFYTVWGPSDHFFAYYIGAPQIGFFSYNMGAPLRSVSLHAIEGATSHFIFFTKYMGAPSDQFLRLLYGAPSDQFLCILFGGPSQISFLLL